MNATYDLWTSQHDHFESKSGQHTNGPAKLFIRLPDGAR